MPAATPPIFPSDVRTSRRGPACPPCVPWVGAVMSFTPRSSLAWASGRNRRFPRPDPEGLGVRPGEVPGELTPGDWNHQDVNTAAATTHRRTVPPLRRDGRIIAGVAAGIADALRVDPLVVRVAFVALAVAGGIGVLLYTIAWVAMGSFG